MSIQPGVGYTFTSSSQGTNLNIQMPWAAWTERVFDDACYPFRVKEVEIIEGEGGGFTVYQICPGTVNNLMPMVFNAASESWQYMDALTADFQLIVDFGGTTSSNIFLRMGKDATTGEFPQPVPNPSDPNDKYPRIYSTGLTIPADTDDYAYLKIAKINKLPGDQFTVDQYVTGSLWANRIKLGNNTAKYFWARI